MMTSFSKSFYETVICYL